MAVNSLEQSAGLPSCVFSCTHIRTRYSCFHAIRATALLRIITPFQQICLLCAQVLQELFEAQVASMAILRPCFAEFSRKRGRPSKKKTLGDKVPDWLHS